jgi:hypothetical protein
MKIQQAGQNITTDPLHLKPEMPLGRFRLQQTTNPSFHNNITVFMSVLPYSKLHALVTIVTSAKYFM